MPKSTSHEVISLLEADDVRFLRILWCDNSNIIRGKAVHIGMLSHYIEHGVGISAGQQGVPVMYDAVMPDSGLSPVGEIRLVPDWSNLVLLPYACGHAQVMGDMIYNKQPWALCPRNFLKRMIDRAAGEGIEIQAAFENEFYLLQQTDSLVPVDETLFAAAVAMDINREVIDEIAEALIAQKIPVEQYYPESGFGQQEISMRYSSALALGAVIAAGIDGVRHNSTLGESINVDPGLLSPPELQKHGIEPLPKNLADAIAHLKQNTTLLSALNPHLAQAFLSVRQAEWEAMQNFDLAAEVKLLLERY